MHRPTFFRLSVLILISALAAQAALAQRDHAGVAQLIEAELPSLVALYKRLHAAPELSRQEATTSAFLASELRALGFEITERVGKYENPPSAAYGVVAVLRNGDGPTVLVRTDMDALPIEEKTGLTYASTVRATNDAGHDVGVMHACGHDVHMASFLGTARVLTSLKDRWRGTLVMIGQPAEEVGAGAEAMLRDGLYSRFPRPDFILALHDNASMAAGTVSYCEGYALANVNSIDVTIRGIGGHGSQPQTSKDPIVLAAQFVLALQTIVSRELRPLDPAVVTVGSIHGGTKHNIIPDEVKLQLTVRSYRDEVRTKILAAIERIARGVAVAAGIPEDRMPVVDVTSERTMATYNDPSLTRRLVGVFEQAFGKDRVVQAEPSMGGEDVGALSLEGHQIPLTMFYIGAADPDRVAAAQQKGISLPSLHSSMFAPVPEPTIRTGVRAMTAAVLELMSK